METTTKSKGMKVIEGRTKLIVPHRDKELAFMHPSYGRSDYFSIKEEIETDGLRTPTMSETASLVHTAFNSDDKYSDEIRKIMKSRWLWAFTGNSYIPNEGVYVQDNPGIVDRKLNMDRKSLVKKLRSNDSSVKFVPFGFKIGEQTSREFGKNPYVVALAGKEGAEKLAEVADKHKRKPCLYSFDSVNEPIIRVSALYSFWDDDRLYVFSDDHGDYGDGYAFGVLGKDAEGVALKNN